MDKKAFRIGEAVTVHAGQSGPQSLATVKAFIHDHRCMELSDGSLWRADGRRQWGFRGSYYKGPVVEPTAPDDAAIIAKRRAIGAIRKFAQDLNQDGPLSAEALTRILDAIKAETATAGGSQA